MKVSPGDLALYRALSCYVGIRAGAPYLAGARKGGATHAHRQDGSTGRRRHGERGPRVLRDRRGRGAHRVRRGLRDDQRLDHLSDHVRIRRVRGLRRSRDGDERRRSGPAADPGRPLQPDLGGRADHTAQRGQRRLGQHHRTERPEQPERGADLSAAVLDQPGCGPTVVRAADQGRLRRHERLRRRLERPGVHEDERRHRQRRRGLRPDRRHVRQRQLDPGLRELPRAVRQGLRRGRRSADLHRPGERGESVHEL